MGRELSPLDEYLLIHRSRFLSRQLNARMGVEIRNLVFSINRAVASTEQLVAAITKGIK